MKLRKVQKGRQLREGALLGPWLHRIAVRTARRAGQLATRRHARERPDHEALDRLPSSSKSPDPDRATIHAEIDRLPERYRRVVLLCDLEGYTHSEAAQQLRWPIGSVKGRLSRARDLLRTRLARRGLAPAVAGALSLADTARAAIPPALAAATLRAAQMLAIGGRWSGIGAASASVRILAEGVLNVMLWNKLKLAGLALLPLIGITAGAHGLGRSGGQDDSSTQVEPARAADSPVAPEVAPPPDASDLQAVDRLIGDWLQVRDDRMPVDEGVVHTLSIRQSEGGSLATPKGSVRVDLVYRATTKVAKGEGYFFAFVETQSQPGFFKLYPADYESNSEVQNSRPDDWIYKFEDDYLIMTHGDEPTTKRTVVYSRMTPNGEEPRPKLEVRTENAVTTSRDVAPPPILGRWRINLARLGESVLAFESHEVLITSDSFYLPSLAQFGYEEAEAIDPMVGIDKRVQRIFLSDSDVAQVTAAIRAIDAQLDGIGRQIKKESDPTLKGLRAKRAGHLAAYERLWREKKDQIREAATSFYPSLPSTPSVYHYVVTGAERETSHLILIPPRGPRVQATYRLTPAGMELALGKPGDAQPVTWPKRGTPTDPNLVMFVLERQDDASTSTAPDQAAPLPSAPPLDPTADAAQAVPPPDAPNSVDGSNEEPSQDEWSKLAQARIQRVSDQLRTQIDQASVEYAEKTAELGLTRLKLDVMRQRVKELNQRSFVLRTQAANGDESAIRRADQELEQLAKQLGECEVLYRELSRDDALQRQQVDELEHIRRGLQARQDELNPAGRPNDKAAPGDTLRIEVNLGGPNVRIPNLLEGDRLVRPDGTLGLDFYGEIPVAGLTRQQIKVKVVEHLKRWITPEKLGLARMGEAANIPVDPADSDRVFVEFVPKGEGASDVRLETLERKLDRLIESLDMRREP